MEFRPCCAPRGLDRGPALLDPEHRCAVPEEGRADEALGHEIPTVGRGVHLAHADDAAVLHQADHGVARPEPSRGLGHALLWPDLGQWSCALVLALDHTRRNRAHT